MEEYYKILGLQRGASIEEIKAAKNKLLQICHPDYFQHSDHELARIAEERTKLINDAYDKLIKYLKTGWQPLSQPKPSASGTRSESNTQTEYERNRAEQERQQREKAEQERIAKERAAEQEQIKKEKAEQELNRQQRQKSIMAWLFLAGFVVFLLLPAFLIIRGKVQVVKEDHISNQSDIAAKPTPTNIPVPSFTKAQPTRTAKAMPERVYCEDSQPLMLITANKYKSIQLRTNCWTREVDILYGKGDETLQIQTESTATYIIWCSNNKQQEYSRDSLSSWFFSGCSKPVYFKAKDKQHVIRIRWWRII